MGRITYCFEVKKRGIYKCQHSETSSLNKTQEGGFC